MATEHDEDFRRFAAAQRHALLRAAWLLTGSRADAEDLVQTALLITSRRFGRPAVSADPLAAAHRALVAAATRRWPPVVRTAQVIGAMVDLTPDPDAVRADEQVREALQELPPRTRAAVVLRLSEDLDDAQLAAALGTPTEVAAALAAEGVGRLTALVGASVAAGRPPPDPQTELRERLDAASWRATAGGDDVRAADAVLVLRRSRRTRLTLGVVAVAALAAAAVAVPAHGDQPRSASPPPVPEAPPSPSAAVRGSLGDDPAFVEGLRLHDWPEFGEPSPEPALRRVVFAGDAGGYRWGLVTGSATGMPLSAWFIGPVGTPAAEMTVTSLERTPIGAITGVERGEPGGVTLLVLAAPGDQVLVSPGVVVGADGKGRREYQPVPVRDGIASTRVAGANVGSSVRYRVLRGGTLVGTGPFGGDGVDLVAADVLAERAPQRPSGAPATAAAVANALSGVLRSTGLGTDDVHPVVLWAARLPASSGGAVDLAAVASTMPSGALVVATGVSGDDDRGRGECAPRIYPAGTTVADVLLATSCIVDLANTPTARSFVVSAPPGATRVTLVSDSGTVLAERTLTGGSAVIPDPGTVAAAVASTPGLPDVRTVVPDNSYDPLQVN